MNTYKLRLITPNREIFYGEVIKILSKNSNGEFEIFANHTPFLTNVVPTITKFVDKDNKEYVLFTSGGVLEFKNNELIFCSDSAEWPDEIDIDRARKSKERAEIRLKDSRNIDVERAQLALMRAITRIDLAENK